jgi:hypothetical protein
MALQTLNLWEIAIDATQIGLCGLILLFLIRNRVKFKQLILNAPFGQKSPNFNTEFIVEAVRQQTELAFSHILESIEKERQTLRAYFELRETQLASGLLKSPASGNIEPVSRVAASEPDAADVFHTEIESLADQGLSLADISEKLCVPRAEVDLVLKLKRLSVESAKVNGDSQE